MYWKASHCVYDCRYHIVWITKYRRKALDKKIQIRLEMILRGICKTLKVRVIRIGMEEDHVHMYVTIPPVQPIPYVLKQLKGESSKIIRDEFCADLKELYWNKKVLWAVGYFVATVGSVDAELIADYVDKQGSKEIEEDCYELKATDGIRGQE